MTPDLAPHGLRSGMRLARAKPDLRLQQAGKRRAGQSVERPPTAVAAQPKGLAADQGTMVLEAREAPARPTEVREQRVKRLLRSASES